MNTSLVIVGFHSAFFDTFVRMMTRVMSIHCGEECEIIHTSEISFFARLMLKRRSRPFILATDRPDATLTDAVREADIATIILHEHLAYETVLIQQTQNKTLAEGLRLVQRYAVCFSRLSSGSKTYTLAPSQFLAGAEAELHKITTKVGLNIKEQVAVDVVNEFSWPDIWRPFENIPRSVQVAVQGYNEFARGIENATLICTKELMVPGPETNIFDNDKIDLTGRGGLVLFGPYASLAPGRWEATICFGAAPNAIGAQLRFICQATYNGTFHEVNATDYSIERAGIQNVTIVFEMETIDHQLEITIHKTKPLFEGNLAFGYIKFNVLPDDVDDDIWAQGIDPQNVPLLT